MNYWLFKTDPDSYSVEDFKKDGQTFWNGVRNYQARNFIREIKKGDKVLFYHSQETPPAVVAVAKVIDGPKTDPTFKERKNPWLGVDIAFMRQLKKPVTITQIKGDSRFAGMALRATGSRLSIQPVSEKHFELILELGT